MESNDIQDVKRWKVGAQVCVILLIVIASIVTVLLALSKPAWLAIISYWLILTAKNLCDLMAIRAENNIK